MAELAHVIEEAVGRIAGMGDECREPAEALRELRERLLAGRFHLAVLGQFKRGKSTLLNALLGEEVLPTSAVPLTAIPTWIAHGDVSQARVEFMREAPAEEINADSPGQMREFLSRFATESGNPHNRLVVKRVEVHLPVSVLRDGLVLIDTPGIGSTFQHNTETTLQFLPQCDAAMFVVSADPPITQTEMEFLKEVMPRVNHLFFVMNKIDYLTPAEAMEALAFFRQTLGTQTELSSDAFIFPVSAKSALQARINGDSELLVQSGMDRIERHLLNFLAKEKGQALAMAVRRKAGEIIADVILRLRLTLRGLELPVEDLQSRLEIFGQKMRELRREQIAATDLLAGDRRRMHETLERKYKTLVENGKAWLQKTIEIALPEAHAASDPDAMLRQRLEVEIPGMFATEFKKEVRSFDEQLMKTLESHQQRGSELIESIRKTAADIFDVPHQTNANQLAFEKTPEPYWITHRWDECFGPISQGLIDKLMPSAIRQRRIEQRFRGWIESLVLNNAGRLREKLSERIDAVFDQFRVSLNVQLSATVAATQGAIHVAAQRRQEHAGAMAAAVEQINTALSDLNRLAGELATG